jgi:deazaflavin-dependent oxidoreductase (nitroreductase family)
LKLPRIFWRLIRLGPRIAYALGLGSLAGRFVLLLTTNGRKSGRARITPLMFQEREGVYYVASARGASADWLRNLQADPRVEVQLGSHRFRGHATLIRDPQQAVAYLRGQLQRRPRAFGAILRAEGLPIHPSDDQLEQLALQRPLVAIRPHPQSERVPTEV